MADAGMKTIKITSDWLADIGLLTDEECGRLFRIMLMFAANGMEPDELKGNERFLWPNVRRTIQLQRESYEKRSEINRENASKKQKKNNGQPVEEQENFGANRTESLKNQSEKNRIATKNGATLLENSKRVKKENSKREREKDKREKNEPLKAVENHAPSVDEVQRFCSENDLNMDPLAFWSYYQARGWRTDGGAPIEDWEASAISWALREVVRSFETGGRTGGGSKERDLMKKGLNKERTA